ncbi:MAG: ABC transporter permease [Phycisphaeraceae bacterium]|nr:MAG: ABC transporter permease [Phycisphaeraceae bacterium]
MTGVILRRLIQLPIIVGAVFLITLALAWGIPGNPLENPEGRRPPPEIAEAMKAQYNMDSFWSFATSYVDRATGARWLRARLSGEHERRDAEAIAAGLAPPDRYVFDLGPSLQYRDRTVNEIIGSSLPVSATLGLAAILIALVIGLAAGVIGAIRPNSPADVATLTLALIGISTPTFVAGTLLLLLFSVLIPIFPVASWGSPRDIILPAITLSLPFAAYIARLSRVGMIEALSSDYIRTARAKGLPERTVILKHALKNAFLPVLSYLGPATALAMTGSFVVERVFTVPGLGQHFVSAVQNKDLFLIMGIVVVFSTMLILFNLAVDVLYRWVDPRIS